MVRELLVNFIIQCVTISIFILIPSFVVGLFLKRKRKTIYTTGIIVVIILSALVSISKEINKSEDQYSTENFSSLDKVRINEIVQGVAQNNSTFTTDEIHDEYWSILNKYGKITPDELEEIKYQLTVINSYMKLYYEDALQSFRTGTPAKSRDRTEYEKDMIDSGVYTIDEIKRNDSNIEKIALQEEIILSGSKVVFDEGIITSALENVESVNNRYEKLFTE